MSLISEHIHRALGVWDYTENTPSPHQRIAEGHTRWRCVYVWGGVGVGVALTFDGCCPTELENCWKFTQSHGEAAIIAGTPSLEWHGTNSRSPFQNNIWASTISHSLVVWGWGFLTFPSDRNANMGIRKLWRWHLSRQEGIALWTTLARYTPNAYRPDIKHYSIWQVIRTPDGRGTTGQKEKD